MATTKTIAKRKTTKRTVSKRRTIKRPSIKKRTTQTTIARRQITPEILHQIEEAAYYIWLNKGRLPNQDLENWKLAEEQILGKRA